jgi:PAS domain S-box-containing protein
MTTAAPAEPRSGHALGGDDVFRLVLDSAPDAMLVVDDKGVIRFANQQAAPLFGYSRAELEGLSVDVLVPEQFRRTHKGHRDSYGHSPSPRGMGVGMDLSARRKDGSVLPVEISLSPVRSTGGLFVAVAVRDVSQRQKTERAAQHLAAMVQSSDDAILSETLDGVITSWNPAAARIFGYTAAEIIGREIDVLLPPDRRSEEREMLARITRGESIGHLETQRLTKDGRILDVALTISPIRDFRGNLIGVSKVSRDITARKSAELTARRVHERLASAVESIQGAVALFDGQDRLAMCNSTYVRVPQVPNPCAGEQGLGAAGP